MSTVRTFNKIKNRKMKSFIFKLTNNIIIEHRPVCARARARARARVCVCVCVCEETQVIKGALIRLMTNLIKIKKIY